MGLRIAYNEFEFGMEHSVHYPVRRFDKIKRNCYWFAKSKHLILCYSVNLTSDKGKTGENR